MVIPSFPPREVSDEMLQRVGLTRERFDRMIVERREREQRAPRAGDPAPDFELPRLGNRDERVRLSAYRDKRPIALIFGSYT